jgi:hypothetical protein
MRSREVLDYELRTLGHDEFDLDEVDMANQPESKLSNAIIGAIRAQGGYAIKIHGSEYMEAGTPDILACIPAKLDHQYEPYGLFIGLEVKLPGQEHTLTDIQKLRADQIREAGGKCYLVTTVAEAMFACGFGDDLGGEEDA